MAGSLGLPPARTPGRTRAFRSDTRKNSFAPRAELLRFSPSAPNGRARVFGAAPSRQDRGLGVRLSAGILRTVGRQSSCSDIRPRAEGREIGRATESLEGCGSVHATDLKPRQDSCTRIVHTEPRRERRAIHGARTCLIPVHSDVSFVRSTSVACHIFYGSRAPQSRGLRFRCLFEQSHRLLSKGQRPPDRLSCLACGLLACSYCTKAVVQHLRRGAEFFALVTP